MEKLTLQQINSLHKEIASFKTIGEWKKTVKSFATKYNISDMTAIDIANHRY